MKLPLLDFLYSSSLGKCAYFGDEESVELTRLRILESGALGPVLWRRCRISSIGAWGNRKRRQRVSNKQRCASALFLLGWPAGFRVLISGVRAFGLEHSTPPRKKNSSVLVSK